MHLALTQKPVALPRVVYIFIHLKDGELEATHFSIFDHSVNVIQSVETCVNRLVSD